MQELEGFVPDRYSRTSWLLKLLHSNAFSCVQSEHNHSCPSLLQLLEWHVAHTLLNKEYHVSPLSLEDSLSYSQCSACQRERLASVLCWLRLGFVLGQSWNYERASSWMCTITFQSTSGIRLLEFTRENASIMEFMRVRRRPLGMKTWWSRLQTMQR